MPNCGIECITSAATVTRCSFRTKRKPSRVPAGSVLMHSRNAPVTDTSLIRAVTGAGESPSV